MMMPRLLFPAVAVAFAALTGCAMTAGDGAPQEDEQVGAAAQAIGDVPPSGRNGKRGFCNWHLGTRNAHKILANQPLNAGGGNLPSVSLLSTCRDEVLANVVECALAQNQWVKDPSTGKFYQGHWGLAPSWYSMPLNPSGRRYVTACLVQRLNAFAAEVPILLEGASPPIQKNPAMELDFPFEESIAYGDLFTPPVSSSVVVNVCYNDNLDSACHANGTNAVDWLRLRICDSSPTCGLHIVGKCSSNCTVSGSGYKICKRYDGSADDATIQVQLQLADACGG